MARSDRQLIALYYSVWKGKRIVFHYKAGRWNFFESFHPWDIREALRVSLEKIDDAFPGILATAAELDDANWLAKKQRKRRYIAESPELIYIDSPHLRVQLEPVRGFYIPTNMPWRDVPEILRVVCNAAGIECGSLANITM